MYLNIALQSASKETEPQHTDIYYELRAGNDSLFGGLGAWEYFLATELSLSMDAKKVDSIEVFAGNGSGLLHHFQCLQSTVAASIVAALSTSASTAVYCSGNQWKVQYCAEAGVSRLCVDCIDPCSSSSLDRALPFVNPIVPGEPFHVLAVHYVPRYGDRSSVVVLYSLLLALVALALLLNVVYKRRGKSEKDKRLVLQDPGEISPIKGEKSDEQQLKGNARDLFCGIYSLEKSRLCIFVEVLVEFNRYVSTLRGMWQDSSCRLEKSLYSVSRLAIIGFILIAFLHMQFPSDDGFCARQNTRESCETSSSSSSSSSRAVYPMSRCKWTGVDDRQSHCRWVDHAASVSTAHMLRIIVAALVVYSLVRIFILDPLLERVLLRTPTKRAYLAAMERLLNPLRKSSTSNKVVSYDGIVPQAKHASKLSKKRSAKTLSAVQPDLDVTAVLSEQEDGGKAQELRPSRDIESTHVYAGREEEGEGGREGGGMCFDRDAEFSAFLEAVVAHRASLRDPAATREFDAQWAFDPAQSHFALQKMIRRDLVWATSHGWRTTQNAREYFYERLTQTLVATSQLMQRNEAESAVDTTSLFHSFVLDLLDRSGLDGRIFSSYLARYRLSRTEGDEALLHLHYFLWDLVLCTLLLANGLFFYFAWILAKTSSVSVTNTWSKALLVAVILDAVLLESLDRLWLLLAVPAFVLAEVSRAQKQLMDCIATATATAEDASTRQRKEGFSTTDHLFVSSRLARSRVSAEAAVILSFRQVSPPAGVTTSSWIDLSDPEEERSRDYRQLLVDAVKLFAVLPAALQSMALCGATLALLLALSSGVGRRFTSIGFVIFAAVMVCIALFLVLLAADWRDLRWGRGHISPLVEARGQVDSPPVSPQTHVLEIGLEKDVLSEAEGGKEETKSLEVTKTNLNSKETARRRKTANLYIADLYDLSSHSDSLPSMHIPMGSHSEYSNSYEEEEQEEEEEGGDAMNDFEIDLNLIAAERVMSPDRESQEVIFSGDEEKGSPRTRADWFRSRSDELLLPLTFPSSAASSPRNAISIPMPSRTSNNFEPTIDALYEHINANFETIRNNLRGATNASPPRRESRDTWVGGGGEVRRGRASRDLRMIDADISFLTYSDSDEDSSEPSLQDRSSSDVDSPRSRGGGGAGGSWRSRRSAEGEREEGDRAARERLEREMVRIAVDNEDMDDD